MTSPAKWKPQPADSPCKCCRCDHPEQIAEADDWLGHTCFVIHRHGCDGRHGKRDACNSDAAIPESDGDDVVTRAQELYTAALDSKPGKGDWPSDALVDAVTVIPDLIRENQQLRETITRLDQATVEEWAVEYDSQLIPGARALIPATTRQAAEARARWEDCGSRHPRVVRRVITTTAWEES
jgi:hypothetical protein